MKDGLPIEEGPKYTVVEEGPVRKLVIKALASIDEADYSCVVSDQKTQAGLFVEGMTTFQSTLLKLYLIENTLATL